MLPGWEELVSILKELSAVRNDSEVATMKDGKFTIRLFLWEAPCDDENNPRDIYYGLFSKEALYTMLLKRCRLHRDFRAGKLTPKLNAFAEKYEFLMAAKEL
jgi:hypothetical protein